MSQKKAFPMASQDAVQIGYANGDPIPVTGTATITSFGFAPEEGMTKTLIFEGAMTLTNSDYLKLPGQVNIVTVAGDTAVFTAESVDVWKCLSYNRYSETPVDAVSDTGTFLEESPVSGVASTVTIDMTNANADLTYTAYNVGADGDNNTVTHVDPAGNNQVLDVTVDSNIAGGVDVVVFLATNGAGAITSTAAQVKAAVNSAAALFMTCEDEGAGSGVVNAVAQTSLAGGVDTTAGAVPSIRFKADGTLGYVKVSETTWKQFTLDALA